MFGSHGAPASVTANELPLMLIVAVRSVLVELGAALNAAVPLPVPDAPPVTVTPVRLLVVLQEQPSGAVTVIDPVPPVSGTDCDDGEIVTVHEMPVWFTVKVLPAIVTVPLRVVVPV